VWPFSRRKVSANVPEREGAWKPRGATFDDRVNRLVNATYDAAQTTDRNTNLWGSASGKSADAEATSSVRATIRNRCRYESRNNSYCRGMLDTRANDTVGKCPRLELLDEEAEAELTESDFHDWAKEVRLGEKLRLAMLQRGDSGEAFFEIVRDMKLQSPVKINLDLIEADRICGQIDYLSDPLYYDGIKYDSAGHVLSYDVLDYHPGGNVAPITGFGSFRRVPANRILHFYRQTRPGLRRGVPDIAPALNLFAMIRRYSMAVLTAAETAAAVAWALVSKDANIQPVPVDPEQVIELPGGSGLTIPAGWGLEQIKAEQPTTSHREYIRGLLNEAARCLQMPLNVALADSSQYNYASGRLDHQVYHRSIEIDRYDIAVVLLSPLFRLWASEYRLATGRRISAETRHDWYFDGFEHVDPSKEASADDVRLKNHTLSYQRYYSRRGLDWRSEFDRIAEAQEYASEKGITLPAGGAAEAQEKPSPADDADDAEEVRDEQEEQGTVPPSAGAGQSAA